MPAASTTSGWLGWYGTENGVGLSVSLTGLRFRADLTLTSRSWALMAVSFGGDAARPVQVCETGPAAACLSRSAPVKGCFVLVDNGGRGGGDTDSAPSIHPGRSAWAGGKGVSEGVLDTNLRLGEWLTQARFSSQYISSYSNSTSSFGGSGVGSPLGDNGKDPRRIDESCAVAELGRDAAELGRDDERDADADAGRRRPRAGWSGVAVAAVARAGDRCWNWPLSSKRAAGPGGEAGFDRACCAAPTDGEVRAMMLRWPSEAAVSPGTNRDSCFVLRLYMAIVAIYRGSSLCSSPHARPSTDTGGGTSVSSKWGHVGCRFEL